MLTFIGIIPHAPVLVPEIDPSNYESAEKTVNAMHKLATEINSTMIDTIIFLLPPDLKEDPKRLEINLDQKARGNMSQYGNWKVQAEILLDSSFGFGMIQKSHENKILFKRRISVSGITHLDNNTIVPLYYLGGEQTRSKDFDYKFVVLNAVADFKKSKKIGSQLREIIETSEKKYAILISGDLAHGHGRNETRSDSEKFDGEVVEALKTGSLPKIFRWRNKQAEILEDIMSQLIMLNEVLSDRSWQASIYSYEKPFDVGYLVAEIDFW